eukprot:PITA_19750
MPPLSIPSNSENISSSDDDSKDDNPPSPSQDPPSTPQLPKWVHATWDAAGIEYTEAFSPVAKMNSIHLVLSLATSFKWEVHQMDVKSTFLHGDLHEEIYMEQPTSSLQTNSSLCRSISSIGWFHNSDWAGDLDDRKSTAGYVFTLGSGPITWACKKQSAISLSSSEAEYRGAIEASKEALWLCQILSKFGFQQQHPTTLWCDNQSAIQLYKDLVQHQRNKHIELHMHFIRKFIHDHVLEVQ